MMVLKLVIPLATYCLFVLAKEKRKSLNMDPIDVTEWGLPADDKYPSIFHLTDDNFKSLVLDSEDPWIVIFYKGSLKNKWRLHSQYLKGSVWYGVVNVQKEDKLVQKWAPSFVTEKKDNELALVFPFGKKQKAKPGKDVQRVDGTTEAEEAVSKSFPSKLATFKFTKEEMQTKFHDWVVDSYYNKNSRPRFPVFCITDTPTPTVPVVFRALQLYFRDFFSFALIRKEDVPLMRSHFKDIPAPTEYPHYWLLLGQEPSTEEFHQQKVGLHFNVVPFNSKKYGNSNDFTALVKFLFANNEDNRKKLPGLRPDEDAEQTLMQPVRRRLNRRIPKHVSKKKAKKVKQEL